MIRNCMNRDGICKATKFFLAKLGVDQSEGRNHRRRGRWDQVKNSLFAEKNDMKMVIHTKLSIDNLFRMGKKWKHGALKTAQ